MFAIICLWWNVGKEVFGLLIPMFLFLNISILPAITQSVAELIPITQIKITAGITNAITLIQCLDQLQLHH